MLELYWLRLVDDRGEKELGVALTAEPRLEDADDATVAVERATLVETVLVVFGKRLESPEIEDGTVVVIETVRVEDKVSGQTVVETAVIAVTTVTESRGHSEEVAAQLTIVTSDVS